MIMRFSTEELEVIVTSHLIEKFDLPKEDVKNLEFSYKTTNGQTLTCFPSVNVHVVTKEAVPNFGPYRTKAKND